jgi:cytochrome c-type biogenesis protein CcmH
MRVPRTINQSFLSVKLCGPPCLCGEIGCEKSHHRDTEIPQNFTERFVKTYLRHSSLIVVMVCCVLFLPAGLAVAKEAQPNEDPKIEQRMKTLTEQLRCLVCQNETLADSRADLAEDLRKQIREQIKAGKSDQEILAFLTERYGDFVLYKPPVKKTTYLLWFGPFVLLIAGTGVLYRYIKNRRELIKETPLTAAERKQAEEILRNA